MHKNMVTKITALVTAITFVLPTITWAFDSPAIVGAYGDQRESQYSSSRGNTPLLVIPKSLGQIKQQFQGQAKTIICIQDLHCNAEVQHNISKIIGHVAKEAGAQRAVPLLVAEEGASSAVNVDVLRDFPVRRIAAEVSDYFVKQGKLTGAEHFAASGDSPIRLVGNETQELYDESLKAVRSFLNAETQGYIYDLREALDELKPKIYHAALQKYDGPFQAYHAGKLDLLQFSLFLKQQAKDQTIELREFPNLSRFLELKQNQFSPEISADGFFKEIERLDAKLREQLYTSQKERELDKLYQRLNIIEKLLNISATPEEVKIFREQRQSFTVKPFLDFINVNVGNGLKPFPTEDGLESIADLDLYLNKAEAFYRLADLRSLKFVDNLLQQMDARNETLAVMVNGGFHIEGITAELKRRNLSFVSIQPCLTRQDMVNPYFSLLQGKQLPLEKLLEKNQSILAVPSWPQAMRNIFNRCCETTIKALARTIPKTTNLEAALTAYAAKHNLIVEQEPWQAQGTSYQNLKSSTVFTGEDTVGKKNIYLLVANSNLVGAIHELPLQTENIEAISEQSSILIFNDMTQLSAAAKSLEAAATQVSIRKRISDMTAAILESFITFPIQLATFLGVPGLEKWFAAIHPEYKFNALASQAKLTSVAWSIPVALAAGLMVLACLLASHHAPGQALGWALATFYSVGIASHMPGHIEWNWLNPEYAGNVKKSSGDNTRSFFKNLGAHARRKLSNEQQIDTSLSGKFDALAESGRLKLRNPPLNFFWDYEIMRMDHDLAVSTTEIKKRLSAIRERLDNWLSRHMTNQRAVSAVVAEYSNKRMSSQKAEDLELWIASTLRDTVARDLARTQPQAWVGNITWENIRQLALQLECLPLADRGRVLTAKHWTELVAMDFRQAPAVQPVSSNDEESVQAAWILLVKRFLEQSPEFASAGFKDKIADMLQHQDSDYEWHLCLLAVLVGLKDEQFYRRVLNSLLDDFLALDDRVAGAAGYDYNLRLKYDVLQLFIRHLSVLEKNGLKLSYLEWISSKWRIADFEKRTNRQAILSEFKAALDNDEILLMRRNYGTEWDFIRTALMKTDELARIAEIIRDYGISVHEMQLYLSAKYPAAEGFQGNHRQEIVRDAEALLRERGLQVVTTYGPEQLFYLVKLMWLNDPLAGGMMAWFAAWYAEKGMLRYAVAHPQATDQEKTTEQERLAHQYQQRAWRIEEAPRAVMGLVAFAAIVAGVLFGVLDIKQGLVGMVFIANTIAWGFFPLEHLLPENLLVKRRGVLQYAPTIKWANVGISTIIAAVNIFFSVVVATHWGINVYTLAATLAFGPAAHWFTNRIFRKQAGKVSIAKRISDTAAAILESIFITLPIAFATQLGAEGLEEWFVKIHPKYKQPALRQARLAANVPWSIPVAMAAGFAVFLCLASAGDSLSQSFVWALAAFLSVGGLSHMPGHLQWNWNHPQYAGNLLETALCPWRYADATYNADDRFLTCMLQCLLSPKQEWRKGSWRWCRFFRRILT